jgi:hypothetical protein
MCRKFNFIFSPPNLLQSILVYNSEISNLVINKVNTLYRFIFSCENMCQKTHLLNLPETARKDILSGSFFYAIRQIKAGLGVT